MKITQMLAILFASAAFNLPAGAQETSASNADLARKLDLILLKMDSLEKRVSALEAQNSPATAPASAPAPAPVVPKDPEERKNFLQKLGSALKSEEARAAGPWTNPDVWLQVRRNMNEFQVRTLLGLPTKIKNSVNPRIHRVYRYEGDLDADGEIEHGVVNFYRGRVISFEKP